VRERCYIDIAVLSDNSRFSSFSSQNQIPQNFFPGSGLISDYNDGLPNSSGPVLGKLPFSLKAAEKQKAESCSGRCINFLGLMDCLDVVAGEVLGM
jgi:hypothetical protein